MKTEVHATTLDTVAALHNREALACEARFYVPLAPLLSRLDCVPFVGARAAELLVRRRIEQKHHVRRVRSARRTHDRSHIAPPCLCVVRWLARLGNNQDLVCRASPVPKLLHLSDAPLVGFELGAEHLHQGLRHWPDLKIIYNYKYAACARGRFQVLHLIEYVFECRHGKILVVQNSDSTPN